MATVVVLLVSFKLTKRPLAAYIRRRSQKQDNAENFLLLYRCLWMSVGFIFVIISLSGSLVEKSGRGVLIPNATLFKAGHLQLHARSEVHSRRSARPPEPPQAHG